MKENKFLISYIPLTIICILLIITPFPYGSVENFYKSLINLLSFAILFIIFVLYFKSYYQLLNLDKVSIYLILLLFLLLIFQLTPIPNFFLKIIAPNNFEIWNDNKYIINYLGYKYNNEYFTISLYPFETWKQILNIVSYFVFGYSIAIFCNSRSKIKLLVVIVLAVSALEALFGIYQYIKLNESASGTYISRTHYAGFLEITIFLLLGYAFSIIGKNNNDNNKFSKFKKISISDTLFKQGLYIFIISLLIIALFLSGSRMGIISFFLTLLLFIFLIRNYFLKQKAQLVVLIFLIFILLGFILTIGIFPVIERFSDSFKDANSKITVWKDCVRIILDYPLFGTGLATFKYIYPKYQSFFGVKTFHFAHNDYIQLIVETGIISSSIVFILLYRFLKNSIYKITNFNSNRDLFLIYIKIGAFCGVISILIHSLADFNLHIPANALYFSLLIGLLSTELKTETADIKQI